MMEDRLGIVLNGCVFFFSSRRRHTRCSRDWSSDVCSSDLTVLRARWGRCSRRAIARYAVATENAAAAWPDGNERRLSRFEAAAGAADVYSTGRLRCASTLIHWVVASVHASALANTTTWPRTAAALA